MIHYTAKTFYPLPCYRRQCIHAESVYFPDLTKPRDLLIPQETAPQELQVMQWLSDISHVTWSIVTFGDTVLCLCEKLSSEQLWWCWFMSSRVYTVLMNKQLHESCCPLLHGQDSQIFTHWVERIYLTRRMEAARLFESSVTIYCLTWHHIPDDLNLWRPKCILKIGEHFFPN